MGNDCLNPFDRDFLLNISMLFLAGFTSIEFGSIPGTFLNPF
jgi:hypothetical protein